MVRRSVTCLIFLALVCMAWLTSVPSELSATPGPSVAQPADTPSAPEGRTSDADRVAAGSVPRKVTRFVTHLLRTCDANRDGRLQRSEWPRLSLAADRMDADSDSVITRFEMTRYIDGHGGRRWRARTETRRLQQLPSEAGAVQTMPAQGGDVAKGRGETPQNAQGAAVLSADDVARLRRQRKYYVPPGRLPAGMPAWFLQRDSDGDGQLTLGEFGAMRSVSRLREFQRLDHNRDGLLTARESVRSAATKTP